MKLVSRTINLSNTEIETLLEWSLITQNRHKQIRARIILLAASGEGTNKIARRLGIRAATVSKWRLRYADSGIPGLNDRPRPGAKPKYSDITESRILAQLNECPQGSKWTVQSLGEVLPDISIHQIWRVLGKNKIRLQNRSRTSILHCNCIEKECFANQF